MHAFYREALRVDLSLAERPVLTLRDQTGVSGEYLEYLEYLLEGCLLAGASRN